MRILGIACLASVLLLPVALVGCGDDATRPVVPSAYLAQSSPANVIENLRRAYMGRDLEGYRKLFSADFVFEFNPRDSGAMIDPTPVSWTLTEELASAERMFSSALVDSIDLRFPFLDPAVAHGDTQRVIMRALRLLVDTRTQDGAPLTFLVPDADATFYLLAYPQEQATDGQPLWRIVRWADQRIDAARDPGEASGHGPAAAGNGANPLSEQHTWGQLKNAYR